MKSIPAISVRDESGADLWSGSLHEFFRSNDMHAEERAFVCGVLRAGEPARFGGGAAPEFIAAVVPRSTPHDAQRRFAERDSAESHGLSPLSLLTGAVSVSPLAGLERWLLVTGFALYVGAVALDIAERLYAAPLVAAIERSHLS